MKRMHSFKQTIDKGARIPRSLADQIAVAMKSWALEKRSNSLHPLVSTPNRSYSRKTRCLFNGNPEGAVIEKFDASQLIQQEPDASSFPSGGIRNTFEARGYTAWDPSSPAFIYGETLCIPTIFVSYTGEALDYKTPLIKSIQAVDEAATAVCKFFDKNVSKVLPTLGWEQEYFLVDKALAATRPDLALTGRTLLGHASSKGQQLNDHYFGSIPARVLAYMKDLEVESMQLGIPVKTRHNEVAPNQYELAPVFEEANLAVDHNSLLMEVMQKVAYKHDFEVLFHEKPLRGLMVRGNTITGLWPQIRG